MFGQSIVANMIAKISLDASKFIKGTSETEKAAEKMDSTTSSAFSKLGAGAEKAFTIMIAKAQVAVEVLKKVAAAAKQIVWNELIQGSYKAASAFEQLSGGAQLMFGEAYEFVRVKSLQAAEAVGMSANEYLQQVNGLAVGLKTALGGDEMAAAQLADKVLTAEADVVAATGNSQEAVQNAFNGIMKSNYMMLDNLQLGIKPTKEGFQELIDQVNAWNKSNGKATNYQIDNIADAQSALVDYIEMQKLAGYAANEASSTIEGAANRLRASWENVKLAIGGQANIGEMMDDLGGAIKAWIYNAAPQFATVIANLGRTLVDGVPRIMEDIGTAVGDNFPKIAAGVGILLLKLTQLVLKAIGKLIQSISDGILKLGTWIKEKFEAFKAWDWKGFVSDIWEKITSAISSGWNNLTDKARNALGTLLQKAENWINDKLNAAINNIIDALPDFVKEIFGISGSSHIKVSLGSEALLAGKEGAKGAEDPTVAELKKINHSVVESEEKTIDALSWFEDAENYLDGIIHAEGGTTSQVKTQGDAIQKKLEPGEVTEGDSLYDQIKEDMQEWYKSYASGNYDMELLKKMQGHLNTLQDRGIYIANYELLNSGVIDPATAEIMKNMPRVPDDLARDGSVKDVSTAVDSLELDPTIEVPEIDTSSLNNTAAEIENAASSLGENGAAGALKTAATNMQESNSTLTVNFTSGGIDQQVSEEEFALHMAERYGMVIDVPLEEIYGAADSFTGVPEEVTQSYYDLAEAILATGSAIVGYDIRGGGSNGEGSESSGLVGAFTTLKGLINKTYAEAKRLGDYLSSGFATAIDTLLQHVCMTSTDEEGNVDASGGNTLVTAMGVVFDLFEDILNSSTKLAVHWTGTFITASEAMRAEAGYASGDLETLAGQTDTTAQKFLDLATNIQAVTAALAELEGKPGAGTAEDAIEEAKKLGAGAKKGGGIPGRASGGPVKAGHLYMTGENGPEPFIPDRDGYIVPNDEYEQWGSGPHITVNVGNVYGESYLKDYVLKTMTGAIRKEMRLAA